MISNLSTAWQSVTHTTYFLYVVYFLFLVYYMSNVHIMDYPIPNRARAACSPSPTAQQQQDNNNNLSIRNISISMTRNATAEIPQLYLPSKSKVFSRLSMSTATATSVLSKSSYWEAVDQNRHLIDIDNSSSPYHACV